MRWRDPAMRPIAIELVGGAFDGDVIEVREGRDGWRPDVLGAPGGTYRLRPHPEKNGRYCADLLIS